MCRNPTEEIMSLPFLAIEASFQSDDFYTVSDDFMYDALVSWTEVHFSGSEERQEIMRSLSNCVRFPFISPGKLEDFDCRRSTIRCVNLLVMEALTFRSASLSGKGLQLQTVGNTPSRPINSQHESPSRKLLQDTTTYSSKVIK